MCFIQGKVLLQGKLYVLHLLYICYKYMRIDLIFETGSVKNYFEYFICIVHIT